MHFTVEKEIFLKGLTRVQGIVEKRNTIPILANVLIEANEHEITITATDLEVGMKSFYPANVTKTGKITVSAKKLYEITKELPEKEISFLSKDNCWIEIKCGKAIFNIVGLSADEFPYFPYPDKENFINIKSDEVQKLLGKKIGTQAFSLFRAIYKGSVINNIRGKTKEEVIKKSDSNIYNSRKNCPNSV